MCLPWESLSRPTNDLIALIIPLMGKYTKDQIMWSLYNGFAVFKIDLLVRKTHKIT